MDILLCPLSHIPVYMRTQSMTEYVNSENIKGTASSV